MIIFILVLIELTLIELHTTKPYIYHLLPQSLTFFHFTMSLKSEITCWSQTLHVWHNYLGETRSGNMLIFI